LKRKSDLIKKLTIVEITTHLYVKKHILICLISRLHGNIDQNVATAVKNVLDNYAEIHGLPKVQEEVLIE